MPGLLDPLSVRGMHIRNRILMPPMANNMAGPDGAVTERHLRHYSARAQADVGFIMVEHSYVQPNGRVSNSQLAIHDDALVPGLRSLARAIKDHGAAAGIQITHCGSRTTRAVIGAQPVGPSDVAVPPDPETPRPLTGEEMADLVLAYGQAARRAVEAGFDAVEVHGAHGYLLCQFVSPYTNHRGDGYGGDLAGRLRFPLEVIAEVRRAVGPNVPLFYRLGADDMVEGGITPADARLIAPRLVAAGIDVIDVSGGLGGSGRDRFTQQGFFVPLAHSIKQTVAVPVIGVGNITEPEYADSVVRDGQIDLVAVGRALLADPQWARKAVQAIKVSG